MVDRRIIKFIERHHVLTLATLSAQGAYCSNAFYAYDSEANIFLFSSSSDTRHAGEFISDRRVAASIVLESRVVGKLQGLQVEGEVVKAEESHRKVYISKFPYAVAMGDFELWVLRPLSYKFTDNRLGFGKKLIWKQSE